MISTFSQFHFSLWWWRIKNRIEMNRQSRYNQYLQIVLYDDDDWKKIEILRKKKESKYMLFFAFERYSIRSHAGCKKGLNWWIFEIQGCVDHESNPFFIYKNRSVPLIGGPCKNMIYFLDLLRTSHRFE